MLLSLVLLVPHFSAAQGGEDLLQEYWEGRAKRFVMVAATTTQQEGTELAFAAVDAARVRATLESLGYHALSDSALLAGEDATRSGVLKAITRLEEHPLSEESSLIFDYSGHGKPLAAPTGGVRDLELLLYDSDPGVDNTGLALTTVVEQFRKFYQGWLILVVDACFSGAGIGALSLADLGRNTAILASSDLHQTSHAMEVEGEHVSAFSYRLEQNLTEDWTQTDQANDGIITVGELGLSVENDLATLFDEKRIGGPMTPFFPLNATLLLAYDTARVQRWQSPFRTYYLRRAIEKRGASAPVLLAVATSGDGRMPPALGNNESRRQIAALANEPQFDQAWASYSRAVAAMTFGDLGVADEELERARTGIERQARLVPPLESWRVEIAELELAILRGEPAPKDLVARIGTQKGEEIAEALAFAGSRIRRADGAAIMYQLASSAASAGLQSRPVVLSNLAVAQQQLGQPAEAEATITKALSEASRTSVVFGAVLGNRAGMYLVAGFAASAFQLYERVDEFLYLAMASGADTSVAGDHVGAIRQEVLKNKAAAAQATQ